MEIVLCNNHGSTCMLKTGVKEGPNKGKSFYLCGERQLGSPCDFTKVAGIPASHCLLHEDSMVELQTLIRSQKQQGYRLYYRCVLGKNAGQRWCGNVPWTAPEAEKRSPLSDRQLQPSSLPPERNPFKAPGKTDQTSEWRRLQDGGRLEDESKGKNEKGGEKERLHKSVGKESEHGRGMEEEERGMSSSSESWRDKQLPAGMKIKKRVSGEDNKESSETSPEEKEKTVKEMKDKNKNSNKDSQREAETSNNSSPKPQDTEDPHKASKGHHGYYPREPLTNSLKESGKHAGKKPSTDRKKSNPSDPNGTTSKDTQAPKSTEKTKTPIPQSDKPAQRLSTPTTEQDKEAEKMTASSSQQNQDKSHCGNQFGEWRCDEDDDDDVQFVSVQPGTQTTTLVPVPLVQKALTSFPGFQPASQVKGQQEDPRALHSQLTAQLKQKKATLSVVNMSALPDKGERLKSQVKDLEEALESLCLTTSTEPEPQGDEGNAKPKPTPSQYNPFSCPGGTVLLPIAPAPLQYQASTSSMGLQLSQGYTQMYGVNPQSQAFYGGRMTDNRLLAVKNATSEAIDHLHSSLESCPDPNTEVTDPKGIKVPLLAHQRQALAWLLWRETQKPCGGILADDMGLGKTLTMIALILAQKKKQKEEEKDTKLEGWISKNDSSLVVSQGTLIICPASLVHHWKKEIERRVKSSRLSIYLYHGPNRQKNAKVLAEHDVVVTTYSLVSKEIPVPKDDAEKPSKDPEDVPSALPPLLRVAWARIVLDEAHNIKNPKVQTSLAVCKLRAKARWAVTGTPIQNNLLDMYALLKFLRCAPFDEFKLWKTQVDNGSKRGGERLNILTKTLLLRRTKDQMDSTGKPLVNLPDRTCEVHRLKLSEEEQSVYDVVFAQSRSTLQNYLKRHEGDNGKKGDDSNPFDKGKGVAREFGVSQADSVSSSQQTQGPTSTVHILSLLLRLRQSCCHLSLLKKTLDSSELQGDGISLSLEEQLNALCLFSEPSGPDPKATVSLNGSRFASDLFEDTHESTKIAAILTELKDIRQQSEAQKSVIVSQWTSMLHIVAVHLRRMGLSFAVIDGTVNPKRRMDLVEEFNTNPKGPQVMLVSLCAGGVGINLIGGNHLFLMDMHWNPALEDQACDRIYRVGQHRDVTIHRFVCEGTVEDKISILQEKKKDLAQKVLSGTGASFTKLSLADLRVIFGV
ncbi:transcription termination factor 2 isoform X1 [Oncorhynchus nerka]|uniref:transcription termination factor 2 isoform X1 n=1 Tax=Oncorhynchus nerka TaxID=8023 RepID=UPI0011309873|nr:transcription termination factor 2 isoform X1 [Oncorhynchus nerka]